MAENEANLNLNLQIGSSVYPDEVRDLEGRYDRKYLCFQYFTVNFQFLSNFFLSGFGIHFFCGFEVSLSIRLNYVRTKRAFYADRAQTVKKVRMQHQNASSEN